MAEPDLHKREARLAARETRLQRRERDIASREAELALALLGLWRRAGIGTINPGTSAVLWVSACVTTVLLAVATLADKTLVAAFDDALGGLAAWIVLIVGWPRPGVPSV